MPDENTDYSKLAAAIAAQDEVDNTDRTSIMDYLRRELPELHPAQHATAARHAVKKGEHHGDFPSFAHALGGVAYGTCDEPTWQRLVAQALPHWQAIYPPEPELEREPTETEVLKSRIDYLESLIRGGQAPALAQG
jgi:hypothetical protein